MKRFFTILSILFITLVFTSCSAKKGEGSEFLGSMLLLFSPIIVVLIKYEFERFKKVKSEKRKFNFKRFRIPIFIFTLTIGSYMFVNYVPLREKMSNREAILRDIHSKKHESGLHFYYTPFAKCFITTLKD